MRGGDAHGTVILARRGDLRLQALAAALGGTLEEPSFLARTKVLDWIFAASDDVELCAAALLKSSRLGVVVLDGPPRSGVKAALLRALHAVASLVVATSEDGAKKAVREGADPRRLVVGLEAAREAVGRGTDTPGLRGLEHAALSLGLDVAEGLGAVKLAELWHRRRGSNVVNYHRVLPPTELARYGRPQMALAAPLFEVQVEELSARFGIVPIDEVRDPEARGRVAITFDDGYEDNYRVAFPILSRLSAPACIFLVTGLVGRDDRLWWDRLGFALLGFWRAKKPVPHGLPEPAQRLAAAVSEAEAQALIADTIGILNGETEATRAEAVTLLESELEDARPERTMLSWDEVTAMARAGISFGSHTRRHVPLDELDGESAKAELFGAQHDLEQALGPQRFRATALPRGVRGPVSEVELANSFDAVMTTDAGINRPEDQGPYVQRRDGGMLTLGGRHHPAKLRLELTGLLDGLRTAVGRSVTAFGAKPGPGDDGERT